MKKLILSLIMTVYSSSFAGTGDSAGGSRVMDTQLPEKEVFACMSPKAEYSILETSVGYKIVVVAENSEVFVTMANIRKSGNFLIFMSKDGMSQILVNLTQNVITAKWTQDNHVVDSNLTCQFK